MNIAMDVANTAGFWTGTEEYIEGLVYGLHRAGASVVGVGRETQALLPDKPRLGLDVRNRPGPLAKWWWEYYGVRRVPRDVDILHIPYMAHPSVRLAVPTVVTVHDLIPYRLSSYRHSMKERQYFAHVQRALPHADRLVAISETTLHDLAEIFPQLVSKARVILNGVHPDFFREVDHERLTQTVRRLGLRHRPRVLYVGGYDVRKNVGTLIEAMAEVLRQHPDGELVLVGAQDQLEIRRHLVQAGIDGRTVVTPFVSRSDLVALYRSADLFVFPSRYEGFGMPPAQALAVGVPVIAGDTPAVREVVQHYGELVPPDDRDAWVDAIGRALGSPAALQKRSTEGQQYAEAQFAWESVSHRYLALYQEAAKERQG